MRQISSLLFLLFLTVSGWAQEISQISHREGLTNSSVLSLAQDADGYLWVGTCDGLNLWDGFSMRRFEVSGNLVHNLYPSSDGSLWMRTNYGIDRMNVRTKQLDAYLTRLRIKHITAAGRDKAFCIHDHKIYAYNAPKDDFLPIADCKIGLQDVQLLCTQDGSNLWIVRQKAITRIPMHCDADGAYSAGAVTNYPLPETVLFCCFDARNTIYYVDKAHQLFAFELSEGGGRSRLITSLKEPVAEQGELTAIIRDGDDYILSFLMNGALRLSPDPQPTKPYRAESLNLTCGVFTLLKDRNQDILWIGTDGSGLLRQFNGGVDIRAVTYGDLPYPLSKPIKSLLVDADGALWIGTKNDGVLRIDRFYEQTQYTPQNTTRFTTANSPLGKNSVYAFAASRKNVLWIAGDGGICYYAYRDRRIHKLLSPSSVKEIFGLYEDSEGVLWAATIGSGCLRIELTPDRDFPQPSHFSTLDLGRELPTTRNNFFSICRESDSTLWLCNHGVGLVHYNTHSGAYRYKTFDADPSPAVNDVTVAVYDADSVLWCGTGNGVVRFDPDQQSLLPQKLPNQQLESGVIHGMLSDSTGNIWISTNEGLICCNTASEQILSFGSSYGLPVVEFSDGAYYHDRQHDKLLFGGINGFTVVSPRLSATSGTTYQPPIQFREITIRGESQPLDGLMRRGKLRLSHRQNSFMLSLAAIDYINASDYTYLYTTDKDDQSWIDNRHNNNLTFANLNAGRYVLSVRYRNNATGAYGPISRLVIRVQPPLAASTWAILLYLLLILGSSWWLIRYYQHRRHERLERRREIYEQHQREILYQSRIWSLTNLTNELSVPLTLINGPCQQILAYKSADHFVRRQAEFINNNVLKISDLIRMLQELKESDSETRCNDIELLDVTHLATSAVQPFELSSQHRNISLCTDIRPGILHSSSRNTLSQIFSILIHNAFMRTKNGGRVDVRVSREQTSLRVEIENDGVALEAARLEAMADRYRFFERLETLSQQGLPIADDMELAIVNNLVSRLRGRISLLDRKAGACFALEFPVLEITKVVDATQGDGEMPHLPVHYTSLGHIAASTPMPYQAALPSMMLINQDPELGLFLSDLFAEEYNVARFDDQQADLAQFEAEHPHIIICSAMMLDRNVTEWISRIRHIEHLAQVPLILLTATPRAEERIDGLELGVDVCLPMPFDVMHLRNIVVRLLNRYESIKDYGRSVHSAFDLSQGKLLHKDDKAFLDKMLLLIQQNILNPNLTAQMIAAQMGMSPCAFYKKMKQVTEQTPATLIKEYRLCQAEQLLLTTKLSIDEVIYKSGFLNRSTFFRSFAARFGETPKVYREQKLASVVGEGANVRPK